VKKTARKYSQPFSPRVNYVAVMLNNRDFPPISCFISEMIQDRAIVAMEYEYKLVCGCNFQWHWV